MTREEANARRAAHAYVTYRALSHYADHSQLAARLGRLAAIQIRDRGDHAATIAREAAHHALEAMR